MSEGQALFPVGTVRPSSWHAGRDLTRLYELGHQNGRADFLQLGEACAFVAEIAEDRRRVVELQRKIRHQLCHDAGRLGPKKVLCLALALVDAPLLDGAS